MKALHYFLFAACGLSLVPHISQAQVKQTDAYGDPLTATQFATSLGGTDRIVPSAAAPIPLDSRNVAISIQRGDGNQQYIDQRYDATTGGNLLYNQVYIEQIGDLNISRLKQNGTANSTAIFQTLRGAGLGNQVDFSQTGNENKSTLIQEGTNNIITGAVKGNDNTIDITQKGNNNMVNAGEVLESKMRYSVTQKGDNHELNQISTTLFPKGYTVEMVGTGIKLSIEQSLVLPTLPTIKR